MWLRGLVAFAASASGVHHGRQRMAVSGFWLWLGSTEISVVVVWFFFVEHLLLVLSLTRQGLRFDIPQRAGKILPLIFNYAITNYPITKFSAAVAPRAPIESGSKPRPMPMRPEKHKSDATAAPGWQQFWRSTWLPPDSHAA